MSTLTFRLQDEQHERLRTLAKRRGVSPSTLFEELAARAVAELDAETRPETWRPWTSSTGITVRDADETVPMTVAEAEALRAERHRQTLEAWEELEAGAPTVDGDEVLAWIASWGTDDEKPVPRPGKPPAPEVAPVAVAVPAAAPTVDDERIDGRTLRRTGRTEQFATRVHPDFRRDLQRIAQATGKRYNEILEASLALYGEQLERERSGA